MSAMISAPGYPGAELHKSQPVHHIDRSSRSRSLIRWFIVVTVNRKAVSLWIDVVQARAIPVCLPTKTELAYSAFHESN